MGYLLEQYVWSGSTDAYIDQLAQVNVNSDPLNIYHQTCDLNYYALQDANYNVLGLVDASGVLKERYEYSPYGQQTVFTAEGTNDTQLYCPTYNGQRVVTGTSTLVTHPYNLCPFGFQGLYHDEEVPGHYYARNREGDGGLGRWMQEDPLGKKRVNLYLSLSSDPIVRLDPFGTDDFMGPEWPGTWSGFLGSALAGGITGITLGFGGPGFLIGAARGAAYTVVQFVNYVPKLVAYQCRQPGPEAPNAPPPPQPAAHEPTRPQPPYPAPAGYEWIGEITNDGIIWYLSPK